MTVYERRVIAQMERDLSGKDPLGRGLLITAGLIVAAWVLAIFVVWVVLFALGIVR